MKDNEVIWALREAYSARFISIESPSVDILFPRGKACSVCSAVSLFAGQAIFAPVVDWKGNPLSFFMTPCLVLYEKY